MTARKFCEYEIVKVRSYTWRCDCHPNANWGYFADYPGVHITDLNYANPSAPGGPTYGLPEHRFQLLADLRAAHQNVRPWAVGEDES